MFCNIAKINHNFHKTMQKWFKLACYVLYIIMMNETSKGMKLGKFTVKIDFPFRTTILLGLCQKVLNVRL